MAECRLIRGGSAFHGKQGLDYVSGVSAETVGAHAICMHLLEMPPGTAAKPHYHQAHETAILVLEGSGKMLHGPNLDEVMDFDAGDFVNIPAGVPHQPFNPTDTVVRAVLLGPIRTSRRASCCSSRSTGLRAHVRSVTPDARRPADLRQYAAPVLELRPNCELCGRDLPPDTTDARICSYECTFCAACVEDVLDDVCPNCGGGFQPRPIRPKHAWRQGTGLAHDLPASRRRRTPYTASEIEAVVASLRGVPPGER